VIRVNISGRELQALTELLLKCDEARALDKIWEIEFSELYIRAWDGCYAQIMTVPYGEEEEK